MNYLLITLLLAAGPTSGGCYTTPSGRQVCPAPQSRVNNSTQRTHTPAGQPSYMQDHVCICQVSFNTGETVDFQGYPVKQTSVGTGFLVRLPHYPKDVPVKSYVLTAAHVLMGATGDATVTFSDGQERKGKVVQQSAVYDLALLEVDAPHDNIISIIDREPADGTIISWVGYNHEIQNGQSRRRLVGSAGPYKGLFGWNLHVKLAAMPQSAVSGGPFVVNVSGEIAGLISGHTMNENNVPVAFGPCWQVINKFLSESTDRLTPLLEQGPEPELEPAPVPQTPDLPLPEPTLEPESEPELEPEQQITEDLNLVAIEEAIEANAEAINVLQNTARQHTEAITTYVQQFEQTVKEKEDDYAAVEKSFGDIEKRVEALEKWRALQKPLKINLSDGSGNTWKVLEPDSQGVVTLPPQILEWWDEKGESVIGKSVSPLGIPLTVKDREPSSVKRLAPALKPN